MVDKDGVELAAIQRLNQKLGEQAKMKDLEIQILNERIQNIG